MAVPTQNTRTATRRHRDYSALRGLEFHLVRIRLALADAMGPTVGRRMAGGWWTGTARAARVSTQRFDFRHARRCPISQMEGCAAAAILVAAAGIALAIPAISSAVADERLFAVAREAVQIIARVVVSLLLEPGAGERVVRRFLGCAAAGYHVPIHPHNT